MINTQKALEVLGLPPEMEAYNGQIQSRIYRMCTVYECSDFSTGKQVISYQIEFSEPAPVAFGLYPFNFAAGAIYHMGHSVVGMTPKGYQLHKPSKWVVHPPESGMAGQNVYYVEENMYFTPTTVEQTFEPYETAIGLVAEDMVDPLMRVQYKARLYGKDSAGKTVLKWQSKYAITPKRRLRRTEFLQLAKLTIEEVIWKMRVTYNIVPVKGETHITSIAMDIDKPTGTSMNSTVYINGVDANTFNYKALINSFGKTYDGYLYIYRLMNGPGSITVDNVYGSTLNIPLIAGQDSTIQLKVGSVNQYDSATKTLTYNPDLVTEASVIAYMEFLPAGGKNENCGKEISLETGIEKLF